MVTSGTSIVGLQYNENPILKAIIAQAFMKTYLGVTGLLLKFISCHSCFPARAGLMRHTV